MRDIVPFPGVPHTCSRETRLRVLRSVRWFRDLDEAELEHLNDRITSYAWDSHQRLQAEAEPASALHLIAAGSAIVLRARADGTETIVDVAVPGDIVGVLPELGQEVFTESVEALQPTCALRIEAPLFRSMVTRHPSMALGVIEDLARRLEHARGVHAVSDETVQERILHTLRRLVTTAGTRDDRGVLIDLPLGRAEIAGMAGTTQESASRVLSRLRRAGIIESGRRWTRVLDEDALAESRR